MNSHYARTNALATPDQVRIGSRRSSHQAPSLKLPHSILWLRHDSREEVAGLATLGNPSPVEGCRNFLAALLRNLVLEDDKVPRFGLLRHADHERRRRHLKVVAWLQALGHCDSHLLAALLLELHDPPGRRARRHLDAILW